MKESVAKRGLTAFLVILICIAFLQGMSLNHEDKTESPMFEYYAENHEQTGAVNLVEAILLDYRAYDTFGEVLVLYISIAGIIILGKEIVEGKEEEGGSAS
ncbi:MAG: hydrogen gas-evolving membrane-bound hydrogenase subunit E [Candidatus Thermoplasmatota archaeon]